MIDVWRFGDVEFGERSGLRVGGEPVEIDGRSAALLAQLIAHAGTTVSKEALLHAGWPNRLVHENSLAKAIGRLRVALGAQGEALISVYGIGYRLNVTPVGVAAMPGGERSLAPRSVRRKAVPALAAVAALVMLGALAWFAQAHKASPADLHRAGPVTGDAPDAIGKVLWVDDNPQNNVFEKRLFEERRIAVHSVTNSADALRLLAIYRYAMVISDMGRGEDRLAGIRLAEQLRRHGDRTPLVIYTVRADSAEQQRAQRELVTEAGAQALAVTPQEIRALVLRMFDNPATRMAD